MSSRDISQKVNSGQLARRRIWVTLTHRWSAVDPKLPGIVELEIPVTSGSGERSTMTVTLGKERE